MAIHFCPFWCLSFVIVKPNVSESQGTSYDPFVCWSPTSNLGPPETSVGIGGAMERSNKVLRLRAVHPLILIIACYEFGCFAILHADIVYR